MPEASWLKTVKHIEQCSFGVFQVLDYLCTCTFCMDILTTGLFGLFISPFSSLFVQHVASHFNAITMVSSCGNIEVMLKNSLVSRCRHCNIFIMEVCMSL